MKINCLRNVTAVVAGVIVLVMGAHRADARPLKKDACDALVHERKKLATLGAEKAIIKGPEWTKANMPAQAMEHVRRYLTVEEMLLFRCKGVKASTLPLQQASVLSTGKKKQKKPAAAQPIKPPPLPNLKPAIMPKLEKKEAPPVVKIEMKPMPAKIDATAIKNIKTVAITVKEKKSAATPSQGSDAKAPAVVVPLPARKPTPAERIAHARAIAAAAARAAALRKRRNESLRVSTPDIQQLLLSTGNN